VGYFVIIWEIVENIVSPIKLCEAMNVPRDKLRKFRCKGSFGLALTLSRPFTKNLLWPFSSHN